MSFLDLATGANDQAVRDAARTSAAHLPTTFGEGFRAAWDENQLFGSSVAQGNAQTRVLDDYVDEIKQKTGTDLNSGALSDLRRRAGPQAVWQYLNDQVGQLKAKNPQLDIAPQSDDEFDQRTIAVSRAARQNVADLSSREGGGAGMFFGGLLGAGTDPVNLVTAPLGGGEGGVLASALRFGGVAAGTQALNEAVAAPFREQVQPGYLASGEPVANVLTAGAEGFALGGAQHAVGTALGRLWTRYKTGAWPTSVRDAGNLLESEANVQGSNVYPGAEGEVAHRAALSDAIDSIQSGEPVDVGHIITPEIEQSARNITTRLEGERAMSLPIFDERAVRLIGEEAALRERDAALQAQAGTLGEGSPAAAQQLARLGEVERQLEGASGESRTALARRRDELLADATPEELRAQAAPLEARRQIEAERGNIATRLEEIAGERARAAPAPAAPALGQTEPVRMPFERIRATTAALSEASRAERAAAGAGPAPELPLQATAAEARAETATGALRHGISQIADRGGHVLTPDEIATLADRFAKMNPDEAASAARDLQVAPRQLADRLAERPPKIDEQVPLAPRQPDAVVGTPEHNAALRADLDRARMTGDVRVPAGVDEKGEPVFRSLDAALDEVDGFKDAADQIQACAAPAQEAAE